MRGLLDHGQDTFAYHPGLTGLRESKGVELAARFHVLHGPDGLDRIDEARLVEDSVAPAAVCVLNVAATLGAQGHGVVPEALEMRQTLARPGGLGALVAEDPASGRPVGEREGDLAHLRTGYERSAVVNHALLTAETVKGLDVDVTGHRVVAGH